ncbi:MAG: FKBP-type peptidyl-prolyl cis-trans isomerase [Bdellovibrionota bacterium]
MKGGTGKEALLGKRVSVLYVGMLGNGEIFDSSSDRSKPFVFTLGAGMVIAGWEKGLVGMKVGGKRKLTIPSKFAYGPRGAGSLIPPKAGLVFEVELVDVK